MNDDGWIKHKPGACPVDPSVFVEVRISGYTVRYACPARDLAWTDIGDWTITHYRIVNPPNSIATPPAPSSGSAEPVGWFIPDEHPLSPKSLRPRISEVFDRLDLLVMKSGDQTVEIAAALGELKAVIGALYPSEYMLRKFGTPHYRAGVAVSDLSRAMELMGQLQRLANRESIKPYLTISEGRGDLTVDVEVDYLGKIIDDLIEQTKAELASIGVRVE